MARFINLDTKHVFEHGGNSATRPPEEKNVQDFQSKSIQEGTGVVSEMFSHVSIYLK